MTPTWSKNGVTIYALCDPSGEPRYVGKTSRSAIRRLYEHITSARRNNTRMPVAKWINKLLVQGMKPSISILEIVQHGSDWVLAEKHWIASLKADGRRLLNLCEGGEGLSGHKPTKEHREKIAAKLRTGSFFNCQLCGAQFWRKLNQIKRGDNKFCSRKCYQVAERGRKNPSAFINLALAVSAAQEKRRRENRCKRGHEFSAANTYINTKGARVCKVCRSDYKREWRRKHAQA